MRKALVVGINRYPNLKNPQGIAQHLTYPAADAEAIARLLRECGLFEVTLLPETCPDYANQVDEKGTVDKATLQEEISKLFNPHKGDVPDVALLFFAGHGWQESLPRNKVKGYLATSDADGKRIYGIPFDWLRDELSESPVLNQIVCLDCCHSGEFTNLTFTQADAENRGCPENVNRLFIAACRSSETAHGVKGHGLLTWLLLRGLDPNQNPKKEWITSTSLNNYVHAELRKDPAFSTFQQRLRSIPYGEPIQFWQKLGKETRGVESPSVLTLSFPTVATADRLNNETGINPFDYGPSVSPDRFYGRCWAIADVKNRIGAISAQCINIVGLRRNGKSSLLRYIKERTEVFCQPEQKPLIVTLDLQDARFHTHAGLIEGLRRGITRIVETEPWSQDANDDPYNVEDGLMLLRDDGYRLIVLLDEFERIGARLEQFQDWGDDWRAKASAGLLTMVIASKRPLNEVYEILSLTSPFSNIFTQTILGALEEDAWHNLVRDGFAKGGKVEELPEVYLQWIDELAGGLPFYTQMAAAMLWQHSDPEKARAEFVFQATYHFCNLWENLTAKEQQILKSAANSVAATGSLKSIADILKRHGLLRSDGRLFSSAFAEFVRGQR